MLKMFKTLTFVDGISIDVQYSKWKDDHPDLRIDRDCVFVDGNNEWDTKECEHAKRYVCQSQ